MNPRPATPELLAPAGDWEAMRAAVANGADAVYFGLNNYNARHRAANFSIEELPQVMAYLHGHNVRGYVTFNTLIFSDELPEAVQFTRAIAEAGVDAVIVQDLGLARLIGRLCPSLPIHGSTQMTLTEPLGIEFVKSLGVQRVILARELSADDIRKITAATRFPVEVFIHGALCVAYSGQCLTSESLGGRSANRGQCAQACRLPYDLVVDGQPRDLDDRAYLLSPQDLAAYDIVGQLAQIGIASLKIEGRLKSAHYVAATTQTYRAALDAAAARRPFQLAQQQEQELAQSFSRGFTHGFLDGPNHRLLVHARFPKSRGLRAGTVVGTTPEGVRIELNDGIELKPGDGVVFDEGHPEQDEQGGRIFDVRDVGFQPMRTGSGKGGPVAGRNRQHGLRTRATTDGNRTQSQRRTPVIELAFRRGDVSLAAVAIGATVWKTDDPALRRKLEHSYSRNAVVRREPITVRIDATVGGPLRVAVRDAAGHEVRVEWPGPLQVAQKFPITLEVLREQFGRTGDTPFELGEIEIAGGTLPPVMVPKSVLNDLRRQALTELAALREAGKRHPVVEPGALEQWRAAMSQNVPKCPRCEPGEEAPISDASNAQEMLYVMARTMEQLESVTRWAGAGLFPSPGTPGEGQGGGLARPLVLDQGRSLAQHPHPNLPPEYRERGQMGRIALGMVYAEFEDVRRYKDAVAVARQAGLPIALATTRILKPGEDGLLRHLAACQPDAILVRNLAGLSFFRTHHPELPLIGDYALNIANELTASIFAGQGVRRMVPSYDLSWTQLAALLRRFPPAAFEAVVHHHMPMFHMEHCVFCATLSDGKDYRDCGRPCDTHRVDLKDRVGLAHPLLADVGCRNTVYNGQAQSAAEYVPRMLDLGLRHFRVELLRERGEEVAPLLDRYADVIAGKVQPKSALRSLRVLNQLGVTAGTLKRE